MTRMDLEHHCRKPGCECQHLTCHRGWRDNEQGTTAPCQWCRPDTHKRWIAREAARGKGYPMEACERIMREGK